MPTILVVDDEVAITEVLRDLLEDEGYHVITARNGHEALASVAEVRPDVVVSDVMMPAMDGWQLCRALQSDPSFQPIPIVLMSAAAQPHSREGCSCTAFVPKPFNLDAVLGTIGSIVGAAGL